MDPWAPINGISLEQYAELSADCSDTQDAAQQAEIVQQKGVSRADWEAAKAGWTARMQDMSLMGQVATRFMPMYQAALARKNPIPQVSYEDYVAMCGCPPVIGIEGTLAHYKLSMTQWTQIAGHWNNIIATNPQYMQHGLLVEQEAARIRAGGAPKPVTIGAGAPQAPQAPQVAPQAPQAYGMQGYGAQPGGWPQQQAYPSYNQQAAQFGNDVGNAFNAFGNALGSFVSGAVGGFAAGSQVMVQWSDGNRYPGTVTLVQNGQVQVAFPDGRQVWVPQQYVSPR
ncbi:MAG: hypothetical protein KF819_22685 [Labilithrix sp.]|nr:hypothetical protein [Labilithrix sp.]